MHQKYSPALLIASLGLALLAAAPATAQLITSGDKYLGGILKGKAPRHTPVQRALSEDWEEYFDAVSPENAGKWDFVEPERDVVDFSTLDKMYQFAVDRGLTFPIPPIIREEREPAWLRHLPPEEIREEVEEWIAALAERYPDTKYIDVVNEAAHDRLGSDELNAAFGGPGETGWDDVRAIYRLTDRYFPDAELMLTDFDVIKGEVNGYDVLPDFNEVARVLIEDGTLDALGPQGHFLGGGKYDYDWVTRRLDELSANSGGLPIHITEFDLNASDDAYQERKYREVLSAMYEHPDVEGVTMWGYYEGGTWLDNAYAVRADGSERPSMQWLRGYLRGPDKPAGRLEAEAHDAMFGFRREGGTGATYLNPDATRLSAMLGKDSSFLSFRHVAMAGATRGTIRYRATGGPFTVSVILDDQRAAPLSTVSAPATGDVEWAELPIAFPAAVDGVRDVFFEVRGAEAAGASLELDYVTVGVAPLPAVLVDFAARAEGSSVDVTWRTASEIGVDTYLVERGTDAGAFAVVGVVEADRAGAAVQTRAYGFRDANPLPGVSYYRLRTVDLDGSEEVSGIVAVERGAAGALAVSPNPTRGERLSLRLPEVLAQAATATVTDVNGRVVYVEQLPTGVRTHDLRFGRVLAAGLYQLSVDTGGRLATVRFLVRD